jgi:hypothetical protein
MQKLPKNKIAALRGEGFSYAKIAEALGVSENTIKSHCQRNQLGGARTTADKELRLCAQCAAPLPVALGNKSKKFCSPKCRSAWWNAHPEQRAGRGLRSVVCPSCGAAFECYGDRKYCSHACYIAARFGGDAK